ncbi:MAG: tetratricopeptide repeat protein [Desulfobacteraceae bacterium]|nr:tetratricopeptide repeat protein [Desulfobacteraceae bacterium]MBC2748829.1 tetratricopeptide repeat protein [Desulfobacteraceae bacterium]
MGEKSKSNSPELDKIADRKSIQDEGTIAGSSDQGGDELKVVKALLENGIFLEEEGKSDEAEKVYNDIANRLDNRETSVFLSIVLGARYNLTQKIKLNRRQKEAIALYDDLVNRLINNNNSVNIGLIIQALLKKAAEISAEAEFSKERDVLKAISIYDHIMTRYRRYDETALQLGVVQALIEKFYLIDESYYDYVDGRNYAEAESICDLLREIGYSDELVLLDKAAEALILFRKKTIIAGSIAQDRNEIFLNIANTIYKKGVLLEEEGQEDQAIDAYNRFILRFKDSGLFAEQVTMAFFKKDLLLTKLRQLDESTATYDLLFHDIKSCDNLTILELVANALFNKGVLLTELGRIEESIATYDLLFHDHKNCDEPTILKQVGYSLIKKFDLIEYDSRLYKQIGEELLYIGDLLGGWDEDDSIWIYDFMVSRFESSQVIELLEMVAEALLKKSILLTKWGQFEKAIRVCGQIIYKFGNRNEPIFLRRTAAAILNKADALELLEERKKHQASTKPIRIIEI